MEWRDGAADSALLTSETIGMGDIDVTANNTFALEANSTRIVIPETEEFVVIDPGRQSTTGEYHADYVLFRLPNLLSVGEGDYGELPLPQANAIQIPDEAGGGVDIHVGWKQDGADKIFLWATSNANIDFLPVDVRRPLIGGTSVTGQNQSQVQALIDASLADATNIGSTGSDGRRCADGRRL